MTEFEKLTDVVRALRAPDGCPWDRAQTHQSLKAPCIEEAAEVIAGINLFEKTGDADNLREELGDLLLQVVMHAVIAEEEGAFTLDDVIRGISEKMIRRHPHVFGEASERDPGKINLQWEEIKRLEKAEKEARDRAMGHGGVKEELAEAFDEAEALIDRARAREGIVPGTGQKR